MHAPLHYPTPHVLSEFWRGTQHGQPSGPGSEGSTLSGQGGLAHFGGASCTTLEAQTTFLVVIFMNMIYHIV